MKNRELTSALATAQVGQLRADKAAAISTVVTTVITMAAHRGDKG
jgi:hypothetical protein